MIFSQRFRVRLRERAGRPTLIFKMGCHWKFMRISCQSY